MLRVQQTARRRGRRVGIAWALGALHNHSSSSSAVTRCLPPMVPQECGVEHLLGMQDTACVPCMMTPSTRTPCTTPSPALMHWQLPPSFTGKSPSPYDYTPYFYSREFNLSWQFYGQSEGADAVITWGDASPAAAAAAAAPDGAAPKFGAYFVKGGAVIGAFVEGPSGEQGAALKAVVQAKPAAPAAGVLQSEGIAWALAASSRL